ncbi:uncharacterized protein LOC131997149 [Stomoxys calcitrans]|uniref:uncharacterized protein LOC131997149 n=1 Tax=Stomoxys calcitrans TaxID=35570 RepID=UPI0027E33160|nr:uncharacterized protein LOC131997149 [Stomoxys calcitrans]
MTIYKNIKQKYNEHTYRTAQQYSKHQKQIAKLKTSVTFLIKCKRTGIIPNFIINATKHTNNIFQTHKTKKIPPNIEKTLHRYIHNFHTKVLKLLIQYKHKQIHSFKEKVENTKTKLGELLTQDDFLQYLDSELTLYKGNVSKSKTTHIKKLQALTQRQDKALNIRRNDVWFVNKTEREIPTNVQWILSLGPKHALPHTNKNFPLLQVIAEGEECVQTIENREEQEMGRTKLTTLIDDHLRKSKMSMRDKYVVDTVSQTRKYLKENEDLLILTADKGGKTVALYKDDYEQKMKAIIHDMCMYRRLKIDPTSRLQTRNNKLVDKLHNLNLISIQEKNKLTSKTALAPRIYGLPKIHKEGTPLRPICSSINAPSYHLFPLIELQSAQETYEELVIILNGATSLKLQKFFSAWDALQVTAAFGMTSAPFPKLNVLSLGSMCSETSSPIKGAFLFICESFGIIRSVLTRTECLRLKPLLTSRLSASGVWTSQGLSSRQHDTA